MPGPAPKPTALKKLAGNPGKRKLNDGPQFSGAPKCPAFLNKTAKSEWKRVVAELSSLDMLKAVDSSALAAYCQSFSRWQSAELLVEKEGQTIQEPIVNKSGEVIGCKTKRHPAVSIAKDSLSSMLRASALFGFSPAERSRIQISETPTSDPFELFMAGLGASETATYEEDYEPS